MGNEVEEPEELKDEEIAELAAKKLKEKETEIKSLKKELAKMKLLSEHTEEPERELPPVKDCWEKLTNPKSLNYDCAEAVVDIMENAEKENGENPYGSDGENVKKFLSDCLNACDGDKSKFTSIYQAALQPDPKEIAIAYKKNE